MESLFRRHRIRKSLSKFDVILPMLEADTLTQEVRRRRTEMFTPVHFQDAGKLEQAADKAESVAHNQQCRLFLRDLNSGTNFLVDTGASISALPRKGQTTTQSGMALYAANGTKINTYGTITALVDFGLRRPFRWSYVLADIQHPIIGADFLTNFGLLVDLRRSRLIDEETGLATEGKPVHVATPTIHTIPGHGPYDHILREFPTVTRPPALMDKVRHSVTHTIETKGQPVAAKPRRLTPDRYNIAREEFRRMMEDGICRPSKSAWASLLHIVTKPDGGIRPCGDYRQLNDRTLPDRYCVPNVGDLSINLYGKKVFSKLDLERAYFNIPIAESDIPKTAITTPFGLFEFTRMCFGLRNASQTFQRFMDAIFRDLPYVFVYIDDILVSSVDHTEHEVHLREVIRRLAEQGLTLNLHKCLFGVHEVDFLGYRISSSGISPRQTKVEEITSYPRPETVNGLRKFLGMVNFYRRSLPHAGDDGRSGAVGLRELACLYVSAIISADSIDTKYGPNSTAEDAD
ncbi:hypothetical protein AAG570_007809 [Ranatra chinensis]|uniref:Reverse transcriptase domain-containing protein n=1 Tax=Ranatra chinensis TaxID=642074 RepID=A0ABD0XUM5_9HEMI